MRIATALPGAASLLVLWLAVPETGHAQAFGTLAVSNLALAQSGYDPYRFDPMTNRAGVYDQFQLDFYRSSLRLGFRFELERDSQEVTDYALFTQRYASWREPYFYGRVGNFYTILGRGITHRSFELPGVVLEEPGNRSRYGPSRDLDGLLVEAGPRQLTATAFAGKPNDGTLSPGSGADRYVGTLFGGQLKGSPTPTTHLGATYARFDVTSGATTNEREWGSGFAEVDPFAFFDAGGVAMPLYFEYATLEGSFADWWSFSTADTVAHALYAGTSLLAGPFTLTAEWKDYRDFRLGTNDPPSLIKEHSRTLLNRSTHVLRPDDEEGYQFEAAWTRPDWLRVTANWSRADGSLATRPVRFEEHFAEAAYISPTSLFEADVFYDSGKDEWDGISERSAWGFTCTVPLPRAYSFAIDFETMSSTRSFVFTPGVRQEFDDLYLSGTLARAEWGSLSFVWERSTDPLAEDPDDALEPGVQPKSFLTAVLNVPLAGHHEATLTAGERRGGRACTAGTCYEVTPFRGVELRLASRF